MSNLQICYVVTSDGSDDYARMTCISALAVRKLHPQARIIALADEATWHALQAAQSPLLQVVDRIVRVETGDGDNRYRSRFVKTTMRRWVDGDFIFLDSDTLPVAPFDSLLHRRGAVVAALDWNTYPEDQYFPKLTGSIYQQLGWTCPVPYYNTGVLMLREQPEVIAFAEDWHRRWQLGVKLGCLNDQPAFNSALHENGVKVELLPKAFNAMVHHAPWVF